MFCRGVDHLSKSAVMKSLTSIIGAVLGFVLGGYIGIVVARLNIGGQLSGADDWLLIRCTAFFVMMSLAGGWLGGRAGGMLTRKQ